MQTVLLAIEIVISVILICLIAIQGKGGGLGSAFGAGYAAFSQRRGVEKFVFNATIVFVILFFIFSVLNLIV